MFVGEVWRIGVWMVVFRWRWWRWRKWKGGLGKPLVVDDALDYWDQCFDSIPPMSTVPPVEEGVLPN